MWIRIRLDLAGSKVERGLAMADTVWVEVTVKLVLITSAAEAKEEDEGEDGQASNTAYCATNNGACV